MPPLRLSQTQLNLLSACPRKFQQLYLEQLAAPIDPDQHERQSQGQRFHRLMQQWQLGLPVEPMLQEDPQLQRWFTTFQAAAAEILRLSDGDSLRSQASEHTRTLVIGDYLLTVVYDLLLIGDHSAKILDWKTYGRPRRIDQLLQNWQTRLYLYVLAETSRFAPADLAIVYWFFQGADATEPLPTPQSVTIAYDADKHEQTRRDLTTLLQQLSEWLASYQHGVAFPQVQQLEMCEACSFAIRCDRREWLEDDRSLPALADIAEVPL